MNRCGCNPKPTQFEFPIEDKEEFLQCCSCHEEKDFCELKNKIICEFFDIINKLECGIQPDLEPILEDISIVYIYETI